MERDSALIREMLQLKYVKLARFGDSSGGVNCFGLVIEYGRRRGWVIPDWEDDKVPRFSKTAQKFVSEYEEYVTLVDRKEVSKDDLVLFCNTNGVVIHIGMMITKLEFIQATAMLNVTVGSLASQPYNRMQKFFVRPIKEVISNA